LEISWKAFVSLSLSTYSRRRDDAGLDRRHRLHAVHPRVLAFRELQLLRH
jgi:hypothetical protein